MTNTCRWTVSGPTRIMQGLKKPLSMPNDGALLQLWLDLLCWQYTLSLLSWVWFVGHLPTRLRNRTPQHDRWTVSSLHYSAENFVYSATKEKELLVSTLIHVIWDALCQGLTHSRPLGFSVNTQKIVTWSLYFYQLYIHFENPFHQSIIHQNCHFTTITSLVRQGYRKYHNKHLIRSLRMRAGCLPCVIV